MSNTNGPWLHQRDEDLRRKKQILEWQQQWFKDYAEQVRLPDKFDAWVEEVRAQKRIEELLKCLCDHLLPKEGQE